MKTSASKNEILKRELEQLFAKQDANIETAAQCLKVMSHPARRIVVRIHVLIFCFYLLKFSWYLLFISKYCNIQI